MRWWLIAVVILSVAAIIPSGTADHARVETEVFAGFSLTGGGNVASMCLAELNVGDACFMVLPHEFSADITIEDPLGQPVAALARLYDADFAFMGWSGNFCGHMDNFAVGGGAYVVVQPLHPVMAGRVCDPERPAPVAAGLVTAGFH